MSRQNRVTPDGSLIATEARGTLMGNRGCIHSDDGRILRPWQVRRWIACALSFRGRWRFVMPPGRWTALFFLDEATALAAGHRPCAECRRADYRRFQQAFLAAHPGHPPGADAMDRTLHAARIGERRSKRTYEGPAASLPDGTFVQVAGRPWLVLGRELIAWTPSGYAERRPRPAGDVTVLTPRPTVAAIRAGYAPLVHPSTAGAVPETGDSAEAARPRPGVAFDGRASTEEDFRMSFVSRGFRGRHRAAGAEGRLPPGQYVTRDFPVLSAGPTPHTPLAEWTFSITGEVDDPRRWTWDEFQALPAETVTKDVHCVTKWSKFDTTWRGVSVDVLLDGVDTAAEYVMAHSDGGYTTNLPLEDVTGGKAWVAYAYDERPLEAVHGGPARLLVPHLYFWKSAKWVRGLRLMAEDAPGFWETYGYHMYGDPWREQRYSGD